MRHNPTSAAHARVGRRSATALAALAVGFGCGARTGLFAGSSGPTDASFDAASEEARVDTAAPRPDVADALRDETGEDSGAADAGADAVGCAPGVVTLAAGDPEGSYVAADATNIYWTTHSTILSIPKCGGTPATLASIPYGLPSIRGLALDSTRVYWTATDVGGYESSGVMSVPKVGGTVTTLYSSVTYEELGGIAVGGAIVYWVDATRGTVMSIPTSGGEPSTLAAGQKYPYELALNATRAYWTTLETDSLDAGLGSIVSVPLDGGAPTTLASEQAHPAWVALDATNVYWTNAGTSIPFRRGAIVKAPLFGGVPTTIASRGTIGGIAVDTANVYWVSSNETGGFTSSAVLRVPIAGGAVTTLASGQYSPDYVAVDEDSLYWAGYAVVRLTPK